jgi:hypothetical protein
LKTIGIGVIGIGVIGIGIAAGPPQPASSFDVAGRRGHVGTMTVSDQHGAQG